MLGSFDNIQTPYQLRDYIDEFMDIRCKASIIVAICGLKIYTYKEAIDISGEAFEVLVHKDSILYSDCNKALKICKNIIPIIEMLKEVFNKHIKELIPYNAEQLYQKISRSVIPFYVIPSNIQLQYVTLANRINNIHPNPRYATLERWPNFRNITLKYKNANRTLEHLADYVQNTYRIIDKISTALQYWTDPQISEFSSAFFHLIDEDEPISSLGI